MKKTSFVAVLLKMTYIYVYTLYLQKAIILSLFKIDTWNFTMYILASLTCPLKTYVRLHNLISMNIFFTIKDHSFSLAFFFIIVKRKPKKRLLLKSGPGPWKTWTLKKKNHLKNSFNPHSINMNDPVFFPSLKTCSHSVCIHCMRDVF